MVIDYLRCNFPTIMMSWWDYKNGVKNVHLKAKLFNQEAIVVCHCDRLVPSSDLVILHLLYIVTWVDFRTHDIGDFIECLFDGYCLLALEYTMNCHDIIRKKETASLSVAKWHKLGAILNTECVVSLWNFLFIETALPETVDLCRLAWASVMLVSFTNRSCR